MSPLLDKTGPLLVGGKLVHEVSAEHAPALIDLTIIRQTLERLLLVIAKLRHRNASRGGPPQTDLARAMEEVIITGMVVEYCRCFGSAAHLLDPDDVFSNAALRERHDAFFSLRSKHLAHDVNAGRDAAIGLTLGENATPEHAMAITFQARVSEVDIQALHTLIYDAHSFVMGALDKERDTLLSKLSKWSPKKLASLPVLHARPPDATSPTSKRIKKPPKTA